MRESIVAGSEADGTSVDGGSTPAPPMEDPPPEEEEEDEDLEISESAPITTFLYNDFQLTTSKRKRIQVCRCVQLIQSLKLRYAGL